MALTFVNELPEDEVQARSQHKENAAILAQHPGQWAIVGDYSKRATATSLAGDINKGKNKAYAVGQYEAEARTVVDGEDADGNEIEKHYVYARFTGTPASAETAAPDFE